MDAQPPEFDVTDYVCGELPPDQCLHMETLLAADAQQAAEAMKLLAALHALTDAAPPASAAAQPSADPVEPSFHDRLRQRVRAMQQQQDAGAEGPAADDSEQALTWACQEHSDAEPRAAIELALSRDPAAAAEAFRMRVICRSLQAEAKPASQDFSARLREQVVREQREADAHSSSHEADPFHDRLRERWQSERRNAAAIAGPRGRWSRVLRPSPRTASALAACLCIAVAGWWLLVNTNSAVAYTLADLPARLQQITSLHVRGTLYKRVGGPNGTQIEPQPLEWYLERPDRYWRRTDAFGEPGHVASDGRTHIVVDHSNRICTIGREIQIAAQMHVESAMQNELRRRLTGNLDGTFRQIDEQIIRGAVTVVYEQVREYAQNQRSRTVLWFNPKTGFPVKIQQYMENQVDPPFLYSELDYIAPNAPPPQHAFSFEAPAGYSLHRQDRKPEEVRLALAAQGDMRAEVRLAVDVDGQAILINWACDARLPSSMDSTIAAASGPSEPTLTIAPTGGDGSFAYAHHALPAHASPDGRWRWSLIVPEQGAIEPGSVFTLTFRSGERKLAITMPLLNVDDPTLQHWLQELPQLSLNSDDPPPPPLTLHKLRSLIEQRRPARY